MKRKRPRLSATLATSSCSPKCCVPAPPWSRPHPLPKTAKSRGRQKAAPAQPVAEPVEVAEPKLEFPKRFVLTALEQSIDDAGWANLGTFGNYLTKLQPDFDSRLYGYKKLSDLVKARTDLFATEERLVPGTNRKVLYVHAK